MSRTLRNDDLLLAHCEALACARPPVLERLRVLIGADLTRLLLRALAGDHRVRSRGRTA